MQRVGSTLPLPGAVLLVWGWARAAGAQCQDDNAMCQQWAANGECQSNPSYMMESCRESCGKCARTRGSAKPAGL